MNGLEPHGFVEWLMFCVTQLCCFIVKHGLIAGHVLGYWYFQEYVEKQYPLKTWGAQMLVRTFLVLFEMSSIVALLKFLFRSPKRARHYQPWWR